MKFGHGLNHLEDGVFLMAHNLGFLGGQIPLFFHGWFWGLMELKPCMESWGICNAWKSNFYHHFLGRLGIPSETP